MNLHRLTAGCALLCLLALTLAGCATMARKDDPRPTAEIVAHAEQLVAKKDYAAAAAQYATVIVKQPAVGKHYLRRAELLERVDADKEAHQTYQQAMKQVPETDPDHLAIMHRLALINANHLYNIEEAETLLQRMPEQSIERFDLAAFLYYQASQYEHAISLLNKALERVRDADQKALLLYHAALIYVKLDDQKNTFSSLYYSINNAEHLGLIRDIEQLWQEINKPPRS